MPKRTLFPLTDAKGRELSLPTSLPFPLPDADGLELPIPTLTPFQLRAAERRELERTAAQPPSERVQAQAQALLWLDSGMPIREVAQRLDLHRVTVWRWQQAFRTQGLLSVTDSSRRGRPPRATPGYEAALVHALAQSPSMLGYRQAGWTVPLLRDHLATETGVSLSDRRLRALLHRLGYRYQPAPLAVARVRTGDRMADLHAHLAALRLQGPTLAQPYTWTKRQ